MGVKKISGGIPFLVTAVLPAIAFFNPAVSSGAVVFVGTPTLLANSSSQTFAIDVTGTDQVSGVNLLVQINDGGTPNGGTSTAPTITSLTLTQPGTIFASNNAGNGIATDGGLLAMDDLNTNPAGGNVTTVTDSGILGYVTVSTLGLPIGTQFTVSLADVGAGVFGPGGESTTFVNASSAQFQPTEPGDGVVPAATITLVGPAVPEPASAGLIALIGAGLSARRRRTTR